MMRISNAATSLSSYKHEIYLEDKRGKHYDRSFPDIIPHSTLYPIDVQWMSFRDIAISITIRYSEWSQLSNGYPGDVQV